MIIVAYQMYIRCTYYALKRPIEVMATKTYNMHTACIVHVYARVPVYIGGVHTGMPNRFRIGLKPIWRVHTEIGLAQTDLDPTHLTM